MAPDRVSRISQAKIRELLKERTISAYISRPVKNSRTKSSKRKRDALPEECHDVARSDAQGTDSFTVRPSVPKRPVKGKKLQSESCEPVLNEDDHHEPRIVAAMIQRDGITSNERNVAEDSMRSITMGSNPSANPSLFGNKDGDQSTAAVPLPPRKKVALMQVGSGSGSTTMRIPEWEVDYRKEIREKLLREMELDPDFPNKTADSTENNNLLLENGASDSDRIFSTPDTSDPNYMAMNVPVPFAVTEKINDILRNIHAYGEDPKMLQRQECAYALNEARHFADHDQLHHEDSVFDESRPDPPQIVQDLDRDFSGRGVDLGWRDGTGADSVNDLVVDFCNHAPARQVDDHDQEGNDGVNTAENYRDFPEKVDGLINELNTLLPPAETEDILEGLPSARPQLAEQNGAAQMVFLPDPQSAAQYGPSFPDRLHCSTEGCRKFSMGGKVFQAITITMGFCVEIDQNSTENIFDLEPGDPENGYPVLKGALMDARMYGGTVPGMQPQSSAIKTTVSVQELSATVSRDCEPPAPSGSHEPTVTVDECPVPAPLSPDPGAVSRDPTTTTPIAAAASKAVEPYYYAKCPYCDWKAGCDLSKLPWAVKRHVLGRLSDKQYADPCLRAYVIRRVLQGQLKMTPQIEMRIQLLEGGQDRKPLEIAKWPHSPNSARDPCADYLVLETESAMKYPAKFALHPKKVVDGVESFLERNVKKKKAVINL